MIYLKWSTIAFWSIIYRSLTFFQSKKMLKYNWLFWTQKQEEQQQHHLIKTPFLSNCALFHFSIHDHNYANYVCPHQIAIFRKKTRFGPLWKMAEITRNLRLLGSRHTEPDSKYLSKTCPKHIFVIIQPNTFSWKISKVSLRFFSILEENRFWYSVQWRDNSRISKLKQSRPVTEDSSPLCTFQCQ